MPELSGQNPQVGTNSLRRWLWGMGVGTENKQRGLNERHSRLSIQSCVFQLHLHSEKSELRQFLSGTRLVTCPLILKACLEDSQP